VSGRAATPALRAVLSSGAECPANGAVSRSAVPVLGWNTMRVVCRAWPGGYAAKDLVP